MPLEAAADSFLNWVYRLNATNGQIAVDTCSQTPRPAYNHWTSAGFKNLEWPDASDFVADSAGSPGAPDNRLPGDSRYFDIDARIRAIFTTNGW